MGSRARAVFGGCTAINRKLCRAQPSPRAPRGTGGRNLLELVVAPSMGLSRRGQRFPKNASFILGVASPSGQLMDCCGFEPLGKK